MRNLAATETHVGLKECMFTLADRQQGLAELEVYERCCEEALMTLDDARSRVLQPVRDVVDDYTLAVTALEKTSKNKAPDSIHEQRIFQVRQL